MPFIIQGKANLKYILIVVILAAIVGGGVLCYQYWWLSKEEAMAPEIKTPTNETTDWKTYRNDNYKYETIYPSDWEIVEAKPRVGNETEWTGNILTSYEFSEEVQKVSFLEKNDGSFWPGSFEIRVLSNPNKLSIKDWWEETLKKSDEWQKECLEESPCVPQSDTGGCVKEGPCMSFRDALQSQDEIIFNNQPAIKTSEFAFDSSTECIRAERNYNIYLLCYSSAEGNDANYIKHNEIYNQIISNFKFFD